MCARGYSDELAGFASASYLLCIVLGSVPIGIPTNMKRESFTQQRYHLYFIHKSLKLSIPGSETEKESLMAASLLLLL